MGVFRSKARSRILKEKGKNGRRWVSSRVSSIETLFQSLSPLLQQRGKPIQRTAGFFPATSHCGVKAGSSPDISK